MRFVRVVQIRYKHPLSLEEFIDMYNFFMAHSTVSFESIEDKQRNVHFFNV